ncbi:BglG family transcription antiterminator [Enterococcus xiangfangensis]|uniref:BglG family transcription antiterminator n=1 Tax=Enterococcus xiangfangensis TaxID=1296537 RepID=UPI0010F8D963|nr:BglG family transcription antiterminator [Enterococcus xiangfangensis]MBM7710714.1 mannitol operon transcriptional antiterminator [Enterococcus xiangfangensis]
MYFSIREKKILSLLLDYPNGITSEELQDILQVSKRTVYREISSIEKTIKSQDIQIIKPRGEGYRIVGETVNLERLQQQLGEKQAELFTDNVQRQSAIVCSLLLLDEEETIEGLAIDFKVSQATITSDLATIEKSLIDYRLELQRLKGRGIQIAGHEKQRRQLLSSLIYNGVSEFDFFQFIDALPEAATTNNFFLKLLSPASLLLARTIFEKIAQQVFEQVTDNQLQRVLILLALSIDRMKQDRFIEIEQETQVKPDSMQIAGQVMIQVAMTIEKSIPPQEVRFFAFQLEGVNYKKPQNIFIDSFDVELSYKIKELIRLVSEATGTDFRKDEQLFNDLSAHMAAALKRNLTVNQGADNPLLQKIRDKYQTLTTAIIQELAVVFPNHSFTFDELGYVVIHFATSLERHPSSRVLSALVVCSSGIGTARILESRLHKYLDEIKKIQVAKISELNQLDYKSYDLILATVFLPGFHLPYKVISPLLLEDEIKEIKDYIQTLHPDRVDDDPLEPEKEPSEAFDEIYETMRIANHLLQNFDVKQVKAQETIEQTLAAIIEPLQGVIVSDGQKVTDRVIKRYLVAPIGIPKTNFALFHCADAHIKEPLFTIYDLDQQFLIQGMDKKSIELTRVLLLLAPDPMPESQQNLLGKISSSVIESDLNTEIYKFGNKEIIYQLLSSLFVKEIREN